MSRIILTIFSYTLLLLIVCKVNFTAQNLPGLESKYFQLLNEYQNTIDLLSAATKDYTDEIKKIDLEKNKNSRNKELIERLMADAIVTSEKIDSLQTATSNLKEVINIRKKELNLVYSKKIDSLKTIESDKNFKGNKAALNVEILSLIEKRLLVRPQISALSYNPKELARLSFSSLKDSTDRILMREYISNALAEANSQIEQIHQMSNRIDEVLSLQQKVEDFVEDAGMRTHISRFGASGNTGDAQLYSDEKNRFPGAELGNDLDFANDAVNILPQIRTYTLLFDQLNIGENLSQPDPAKWNRYLNNAAEFIPLEDYRDILREIEIRLTKYSDILKKKLQN